MLPVSTVSIVEPPPISTRIIFCWVLLLQGNRGGRGRLLPCSGLVVPRPVPCMVGPVLPVWQCRHSHGRDLPAEDCRCSTEGWMLQPWGRNPKDWRRADANYQLIPRTIGQESCYSRIGMLLHKRRWASSWIAEVWGGKKKKFIFPVTFSTGTVKR